MSLQTVSNLNVSSVTASSASVSYHAPFPPCSLCTCVGVLYTISADPLPARGRRWGSVRLALERDCGSLLPSLSPSPVQPCTLPAFFLSFFSCSSSFLFFPVPFGCRRTPLVGARCGQTSAAWTSAGREAFVAGRSLWTDSLTAYWTQTRR